MALTTVESPSKKMVEATSKSPAKVTLYEENTVHQFGTTSQARPSRIAKITIDHLALDVPSEQMLKEIFAIFDQDGKGYIDRDRFREVMKSSFDNFGAPMNDKDVDRLFMKLDAGDPKAQGKGKGDGKLCFEEFSVLILSKLKL
jgi:hypothetical protein